MKIKELHLRNIASIEQADIDFENGLRDIITNDPASIFLISGDTGTGKSVILDGIAMALYKKTPRTAGVANPTQNRYTDTEGESININSIEQYTRLGISEKDDCYSKLVFEGNDGRIYHAKLELGITKGNTDENGHRALKHRSPKWMWKVDEEDWQKVEVKTGQPLLNAVGLSFEQFGRMAMLAQGQFASFLTGDKKERESILEQLTNTERFTTYGTVISALFNKAKNNKADAQTAYDTEKGHTLSPEEVAELTNALAVLEKEKKALESERDKESNLMKDVQAVNSRIKERRNAEEEKKKLEDKAGEEQYQMGKALVADWDATNSQRKMLADKQTAESKKKKAETELTALATTHADLMADLVWRKEQLAELTKKNEQLEIWLNERKTRNDIYTNCSAVAMQLEQYTTAHNKLKDARKLLADEKAKTEQLNQKVNECTEKQRIAEIAAKNKQNEVDKITAQHKELHPAEISEQIKAYTQQKTALEKLQERITIAEQERQRLDEAKQGIESDRKQLDILEQVHKKAQGIFEEKKAAEEQARTLLNTMKMSMEDTLNEIRQRLIADHADSCPLCGQHIDHTITDVDFLPMITPLQQKENEAKDELNEAIKNRENAKSKYDTLNGALKTKEKNYETNASKLKEDDYSIALEVTKLGLKTSVPPAQQITDAISEAVKAIAQLSDKQTEAENLMNAIIRLTKEKTPLDEAKNNADKELLNAQHAVQENMNAITEWTNKVTEHETEKKKLHLELGKQMDESYPQWATDTVQVKNQFEQEAKAYNDTKAKTENNQREQEKEEQLILNITNIAEPIASRHTEWDQPVSPREYTTADLLGKWVALSTAIVNQDSIVSDANATIASAISLLNAYYDKSGKTEKDLNAIIDAEKQVTHAREYVTKIDTDLKSREDAIRDYTTKIDDLMQKLEITDLKDLPEEQPLQDRIDTLNVSIKEKTEQTGAKQAQLKTNQANVERLGKADEVLKAATDVYNRWERINSVFGGTRFRTLVQTYILRPLLNNANIYLKDITDRYTLTCSEENDQLSILVLDRYNKNQVRSVTVLSGGERFMISLALSLALSSLNRQDMNVNILFIDEGFGTLDENNLNSVMSTLEKLQEIAGQTNRRVGIISHREELVDRIPVKIHVKKKGEGRSIVEIKNGI